MKDSDGLLKPLLLSASSYSGFVELKICSLLEFFESLSLIDFGSWSRICFGWFEETWMYISESFGFL